ncbi:MAG: DUF924 family protein [Paracoccus sp. (in: a-proteobacteria)]|nr:DUF924 family protein [Paracoccus sp. (in: a-proteobacteria)]
MPATPADILSFWFSDQIKPYWFAKSETIDKQITARFWDSYEAAHAGRLDHWMGSADDALALVIALDQFPRNIYRGGPRAFESDALALHHATMAIEAGHDAAQSRERRTFFYLPFMHSETLQDQDRSIALYTALGDATALDFAQQHRDIIARFGRFPHRNAILGRQSTEAEQAFLRTHPGF